MMLPLLCTRVGLDVLYARCLTWSAQPLTRLNMGVHQWRSRARLSSGARRGGLELNSIQVLVVEVSNSA